MEVSRQLTKIYSACLRAFRRWSGPDIMEVAKGIRQHLLLTPRPGVRLPQTDRDLLCFRHLFLGSVEEAFPLEWWIQQPLATPANPTGVGRAATKGLLHFL